MDTQPKYTIIDGIKYSVTEDNDRIYFKENSNRKLKSNFSFSKNPDDNKVFTNGLKIFWTAIYS